jgi:hypothetical protein
MLATTLTLTLTLTLLLLSVVDIARSATVRFFFQFSVFFLDFRSLNFSTTQQLFHIQAEVVKWSYTDDPDNDIARQRPLTARQREQTLRDATRLGSTFDKAQYVQYTDDTFKTRTARRPADEVRPRVSLFFEQKLTFFSPELSISASWARCCAAARPTLLSSCSATRCRSTRRFTSTACSRSTTRRAAPRRPTKSSGTSGRCAIVARWPTCAFRRAPRRASSYIDPTSRRSVPTLAWSARCS